MRVTRAFVASCGAGLSLVAAAVTLLFVLSAVVAVTGWPGIDPDDDVPRLVVSDDPVSAPGGGGTGSAVPATAAGVGAAPIVLGPVATAQRTVAGAVTPDRTGGRAGGGDGPLQGPVTGNGDSAGPSPTEGGTGPAPRPIPQTTVVAGDAIRDTGSAVGSTADQVAPGSGGIVRDATGTVADTIEQTGRVVEGVTAPVGRTVEGATGATGRTVEPVAPGLGAVVEDTGRAMSGLLGGANR